ncbi:MAG: extracellular matrix/biofilm biosynthesis regulator RemA family protein [Dehalococcoidia bacterium]
MTLVHAGFGKFLRAQDITAITLPTSAPIQRMIKDAKKGKRSLNYTGGRRTKAVVFTASGQIVLVAITPEALAGRVTSARQGNLQD